MTRVGGHHPDGGRVAWRGDRLVVGVDVAAIVLRWRVVVVAVGVVVLGGIAADLAVDANVVAATGDGGFLMNAAELDTATRLGRGFTVLVFNDDDYGLISAKQTAHTGEHFGTELTNPDIVAFAESFDIDAYRPDEWSILRSVLAEVVPSPELAVVEVSLEKPS